MGYIAEERAIIWLHACSGKDYRESVSALRAARDPARLLSEENDRELEAFLQELEGANIFAVTLVSDDYPESLKAISDPPLVLYGRGNRGLLKSRKFAIVGSRITPPWAEKFGRRVSEELSERFVIVTGLAEGGDSAAIAGALSSGNLISVLPCGLEECYPAAHVQLKTRVGERGLLLSEYKPREQSTRYAFHARNRLLAGLSEGVLVLSAGERSGTLITANRALEYGREVFALPHNVGVAQGAGCNELIKKGAYLVTDTEDILSCYGMRREKREQIPLTEEEREIFDLLRERGEMHAAQLAALAGIQIFEVTARLSSLEIKGVVVKSGGNKYSVV